MNLKPPFLESIAVVNLLLAHSDIDANVLDKRDETPLMIAMEERHSEVIKLLESYSALCLDPPHKSRRPWSGMTNIVCGGRI
jgi:ankyrin repeat protein